MVFGGVLGAPWEKQQWSLQALTAAMSTPKLEDGDDAGDEARDENAPRCTVAFSNYI